MCLWEANKRDFDPLEGLGKEMGSVSFCSAGRMGKRGNFAAFELWSLEGQGKKMDFAPFKGLGGKKGILRRWKGWMKSVGIHREGEKGISVQSSVGRVGKGGFGSIGRAGGKRGGIGVHRWHKSGFHPSSSQVQSDPRRSDVLFCPSKTGKNKNLPAFPPSFSTRLFCDPSSEK